MNMQIKSKYQLNKYADKRKITDIGLFGRKSV
jgi:hypothetical protein